MYSELKDKVALITGSTKGIGRGIAEKYASLGIKLILNYSSDENSARETEQILHKYGVEFIIHKADVSNPVAIQKLFATAIKRFGQIDIVVANAGVELVGKSVIDSTEEDFDRIFNINLKGTFFVMQEAAKYLPEGGRIILVSSTMSIHPDPGAAIYAASKAASKLFVDVLAKELGSRQITVNSVMPGIIDNAGVITAMPPDVKQKMSEGSPLGRLGTVADVGNVAAYLASADASFIHGHHLQVNGGSIY